MLKFVDFKVTFQEVPDEISLCINLSNCPHHCKGCHSPYLQEDIGTVLTTQILDKMIESNNGITCVCFLGGDNDIPKLTGLADYVRRNHNLRTAWYSGNTWTPQIDRPSSHSFDYIKTGPYIESFGPLTSRETNQKMYARGVILGKKDASPYTFYDITDRFWKDGNNNEEAGVETQP